MPLARGLAVPGSVAEADPTVEAGRRVGRSRCRCRRTRNRSAGRWRHGKSSAGLGRLTRPARNSRRRRRDAKRRTPRHGLGLRKHRWDERRRTRGRLNRGLSGTREQTAARDRRVARIVDSSGSRITGRAPREAVEPGRRLLHRPNTNAASIAFWIASPKVSFACFALAHAPLLCRRSRRHWRGSRPRSVGRAPRSPYDGPSDPAYRSVPFRRSGRRPVQLGRGRVALDSPNSWVL
jgi:hypothetical protein